MGTNTKIAKAYSSMTRGLIHSLHFLKHSTQPSIDMFLRIHIVFCVVFYLNSISISVRRYVKQLSVTAVKRSHFDKGQCYQICHYKKVKKYRTVLFDLRPVIKTKNRNKTLVASQEFFLF